MSTLNATPRGNRLHIGIFGRRNAGKSSFVNRFTGQDLAIVSDVAGTTADPVYKSMEIHPLGPCVLIDTAGFDDEGALGELRVEKTREAARRADIAILLLEPERPAGQLDVEREWLAFFRERKIPVLAVLNKTDLLEEASGQADGLAKALELPVHPVSAASGEGFPELLAALVEIPVDFETESLTGHLVQAGDSVLLVMPQDIQAPKGRLILPQVQTIRDLLDLGAIPVSVTTGRLEEALALLREPPALIITDSQAFREVYAKKPAESRITSFSVLMARSKGDIAVFAAGARAIDNLREGDRVLIAEACTHKPLDGDIGRVKLPALLRKQVGEGLRVDVVAGNSFPEDLSPYSLVIHCGACMFNRRHVLSRILQAENAGVPITNYGVALAKLTGILEQVEL